MLANVATLVLVGPVCLHYRLLVNFAHGIPFDFVHNLQDCRDLVRCHLLLQLRTETLELQWLGLLVSTLKTWNRDSYIRSLFDHCGHTLSPFII